MGENICKQCNWQGISLQTLQPAHAAQYHKNNPVRRAWWRIVRGIARVGHDLASKQQSVEVSVA